MAGLSPMLVVLTPDALGHALLESEAVGMVQAWRDRRIRLVVDRTLILRYLRLLRRLALPERLLRWWGWWLGSPEKALILPDPPVGLAGVEHYRHLAVVAGAAAIVYWPGFVPAPPLPGTAEGVRWLTPQELFAGVGTARSAWTGPADPEISG